MVKLILAVFVAVALLGSTPATAQANYLSVNEAKYALMGYYHDDDVRDYARRRGWSYVEWGSSVRPGDHKVLQTVRYYNELYYLAEKVCFRAYVYHGWNVIYDEVAYKGAC